MFIIFAFGFLGTIILTLAYYFIIKPYLLVLYYRKQGLNMYFYPGLGFMHRDREYADKYLDEDYFCKTEIARNIQCRAWGGNLVSRPAIHLFDPNLVREFNKIELKYYVKDPYLFSIAKLSASTGLVFSEKELWKKT